MLEKYWEKSIVQVSFFNMMFEKQHNYRYKGTQRISIFFIQKGFFFQKGIQNIKNLIFWFWPFRKDYNGVRGKFIEKQHPVSRHRERYT